MKSFRWIGIGATLAAALVFAIPVAAADREESLFSDTVIARWGFDSPEEIRGWRAGEGIDALRVEGGALRARMTAADAYLFLPPREIPAAGLLLRVTWRCDRAGGSQCYFATRRSPHFGEDKVINLHSPGGRWVTAEFDIGARAGTGARITALRLDPFNGNPGAEFAIDEVVLLVRAPRFEAHFAPERLSGGAGEPVRFRLWLRHLGGKPLEGSFRARFEAAGGPESAVREFGAAEAAAGVEAPFRFEKGGVHRVRAVLESGGRRLYELEASVAVEPSPPPKAPPGGGRYRLEFLEDAAGGRIAGARLWTFRGGAPVLAAWLLPLAEVAFKAEDGAVVARQPAFERVTGGADRLVASLETGGRIALRFAEAAGARLDLEGNAEVPNLLCFRFPVVKVPARGADPLARYGLFGGLEFLGPGYRSSSERGVGERYAARWTPKPWKTALPVMAIEEGGVVTALLWDPRLQAGPPAATFASPDFLERAEDHHLLALSHPAPGPLRDENTAWARAPLDPHADLEIRARLYAGEGDILDAARLWYDSYGIPEPPPAPHSAERLYDLIAQSYGETLFWPEERGWRMHWFLERQSRWIGEFAAELILHARLRGERRWLEATGLDAAQEPIDTAGTLWDRALGGHGAAEAAQRNMRADGTFAYRESPQARERTRRHSGGRYETLGEEGATTLGTCVQGALPFIRHAALTGEESAVNASRRALAALERFRVPRGAQVWEVPLETPDIRAAALAVEAFRLGYVATGDERYLDRARYWAEAGLPFVVSWRMPVTAPARVRTSRDRDRPGRREELDAAELYERGAPQATPYAAIPVLGTSFYVVSWFGVAVQWCGLEWAEKVLELVAARDDPVLRAAALGVFRSGWQQMFDRRPWVGLYPDSWDLERNFGAGALLAPRLIASAGRAGGVLPQALRMWSRRVKAGSRTLLVHGWGRLLSADGEGGEGNREGGGEGGERLEAEIAFPAGLRGELLVARSPRPHAVSVDGRPAVEDPRAKKETSWRWDPGHELLQVRYRARGETARIEIRWRR